MHDIGGSGGDDAGSAWGVIASHDDAAALIDTLLDLDDEAALTKTELSDCAGVPLKSLYLNGTLDAITDLGLLDKREREGEEPLYSVAAESPVFEAAEAFQRAATRPAADSA